MGFPKSGRPRNLAEVPSGTTEPRCPASALVGQIGVRANGGFLVHRAYKALLPDERAAPFLKPVAALHVLAEAVRRQAGASGHLGPSGEDRGALDEKIEGVAITAPI